MTMRVPVSRGVFVMVEFDPNQTVDFAPLRERNGAGMSQTSAPLFLKPLKENGAGAPLLHSAPTSSQEWRKPSPSGEFLGVGKEVQKTAREELEEVVEALADRASELASIDSVLAPVRAEEFEIRAQLLETYDSRKGVIVFNHCAKERAPLFRRLTEISVKWGKQKSERAQVNTHVKSLEREADQLRRIISRESKKKVSA